MEKRQAYSTEINSFREKFADFRNKRIVLYGIGRYTATLVPALKGEFRFVGLMDREKDNIGKVIHGLPVLSLEQAEKQADMIIINTSSTYWRVIYHRIRNSKLPVFYLDGSWAIEKEEKEGQYYSRIPLYEEIYERAMGYELVTFDVFDTLIMRSLISAKDVFKLVENRINEEMGVELPFAEVRSTISSNGGLIKLEQLYQEIQNKLKISNERCDQIMNEELAMERKVSIPRRSMVELCNRIAKDREVILVSDMYLPTAFVRELVESAGVVKNLHIMVSADQKANKTSGQLWEKLTKSRKGAKVLHIGDNPIGDERVPQKYGVDTIRIPGWLELMEQSEMADLIPEVVSLEDSLLVGLVGTRLFGDPFKYTFQKGKNIIEDYRTLGYVLFGSLIYPYLDWIVEHTKSKKLRRIVFFARDGYWLIDDYQFLKEVRNDDTFPESVYLPISRGMVLVSQIDEPNGWEELLGFPYAGTFEEYVKIRLHYDLPATDVHRKEWVGLPEQKEEIIKWIEPYEETIIERLHLEKKRYIDYLNHMEINETDAVVDPWANGSNQYYLSRTVNCHLKGFYIEANLSEDNRCQQNNDLYGCFNEMRTINDEKSYPRRMAQFVEAFLTAPYGMILSMDEEENFVCAPKMKNQKNWNSRIEMNDGVKEFIKEFESFGVKTVRPSLVNLLWKEMYEGHLELSEKIKKVFYYDNVLVKSQEVPVFE